MQLEPQLLAIPKIHDKATTIRGMNARYLSVQCSSSYDITYGGQSITNVTLAANMLIHDLLHEVNNCTYPPYPAVVDVAAQEVVLGKRWPVLKQRYEWLGDKWLSLFIGELLSEALPLSNGEASVPTYLLHLAQGELQSNLMFSLIAVKHGMAKAPFMKPSANTFEAYVHILRHDINAGTLQPWLRGIFEPLIRFFLKNYVLRIRTFEQFQADRYQSKIQMRAGVVPDDRGRYWRGILWAAEALPRPQPPTIQAGPSVPQAAVANKLVSSEEAVERCKFDGRIIAVMKGYVEVDIRKLHLPLPPRIWLWRCDDAIEDFKFDDEKKCISVTWKPPPKRGLGTEDFEVEDEEDDEYMVIESHSSTWKEGSLIQVWVPFEGNQHDRSRSLVVAHPWDDRLTITTDE
ncbi:hypothetical protein FRB95_009207 [Tulasnella sp. JGI-2019a]|nr:hypothetical protein FRB95_009207 [Tulasnella sp. JGI-2019a]